MTSPNKRPVNDNRNREKCPICSQPAEGKWRPFCSKRCADVDLHRWLNGGYAIPAVEAEEGTPADFDEE